MFTPRRARDKTTRHSHGVAAIGLLVLWLLLGGALAAHAAAQPSPWHVVQASDGALYLITDRGRYTLQVDAISDDDLAALVDAGPIGPLLAAPPGPAGVAPTPPDTSAEVSGGAPPEFVAPPASDEAPVTVPAAESTPPVATPELAVAPRAAPEVVPGVLTPTTPAPLGVPPSAGAAPLPSGASLAPPRPGVPPSAGPGAAGPANGPASVPPSAQSLGVASPTLPTPAPTPVQSASGAEAPVLLSGIGSQTTRTFTLRGGTYTALWSANTTSTGPDTFAAILRPADPANLHTQVLGTMLVPGGRSVSGQAQVTGLPAGSYSVEVVGGTTWSLSVSPQTGSPGASRP